MGELLRRDPAVHARLHRDRDDLEHGRGGQGPEAGRAQGDQPRGDRRVRDLRAAAGDRAVGAAGAAASAPLPDAAGCRRPRGGMPATRCWASSSTLHLGPLQHAAEIYVGLLAATILFIATNAGIIGVSRLDLLDGTAPTGARPPAPAASEVRHAVDRDHDLQRDRCDDADPGPGHVPREPVRVRRDAVVHDRPPVGDRACGSRCPTSSGPYRPPGTICVSRARSAAVRDRRRYLHVRLAVGAGRAAHERGDRGDRLAGDRDDRLPDLPPPPWARPRRRPQRWRSPRPATETESEYESVLVAFDERPLRARGDGDRSAAGRPAAPRDPHAW